MPKLSAGLLVFKTGALDLEVFLVHPGGPYWTHKEDAVWSIPKGECEAGEEPFATALREFTEETGFQVAGEFLDLGEVRQSPVKVVKAWAVAGDFDAADLRSNTFEMEWPPKSGQKREFPEVDRGGWFTVGQARKAMHAGQLPFLDRLQKKLFPASETGR